MVRDARWRMHPLRRGPADSLSVWMVKIPVRVVRWILWIRSAVVRARRLHALHLRERSATVAEAVHTDSLPRGLERCDIRYINLDHRTDRRAQFEAEMQRIGVSRHQRVPGVSASPGILGCARAHLQLLDSWEPNPQRLLFVCEDDVEFVASREDIDAVIEEFAAAKELKVLMLAHNAAWHIPISDSLALSSDILTTAAFVVRAEIVTRIRAAFKRSEDMLVNGAPTHEAALDLLWREVQENQLFALANPRCAVQREGYSDIEGRFVQYKV
jgi:hypothetical protein